MLLTVQIRIAAKRNQPRKLLEPIDAPHNVVRLLVGDYLAGQVVKLGLCHDCTAFPIDPAFRILSAALNIRCALFSGMDCPESQFWIYPRDSINPGNPSRLHRIYATPSASTSRISFGVRSLSESVVSAQCPNTTCANS